MLEVAFGCRVLPERVHTLRPDPVVRYTLFDRVCAQPVASAPLLLAQETTFALLVEAERG